MTLADSLRHLGRSAPDPRTDGELLTLFVRSRDEPAFAELLRRHGPTVFGVCRRVLGHPDADDAFQAVWLVLARKAGSVRPPGMVGNWLYGVAVRTANKARVMNAKRRARELTSRKHERRGLESVAHASGSSDTAAVIDAELAALPDLLRAAFVACDLNGRTRSEAARELGWPEGTVAARLAKARAVLAERLRKRGVTLAAGALAAVAVPPALASSALAAVSELLAVGAAASAPAAEQLSSEVARTMNPINWKLATTVAGVLLSAGVGGAVQLAGGPDKQPVREQIKVPVPKETLMEWKEGKPIELDGGPITSMAASADGKLIALTQQGKVTLLEADTRKQRFAIAQNLAPTVTAVAFNPKGDKIAFTTTNSVDIRGVDIKDPGESWEMKGVAPRQVLWLSDDSIVATNGEAMWWQVKVKDEWVSQDWTAADGKQGRQIPLAALPGQSLNYVTVGVGRKKESELQIVARAPQSSPQTRLEGHKSRPIAAAVSADGKRIVSADEKGTLIVWEGEKLAFEEKRRVELGEGVQALALAPDGKTVAVTRAYTDTTLFGTSGRTLFNLEVCVLDATDPPEKPKPMWSVRNVLSDAKTFTGPASLAFAPDGKTLYAAFADPSISEMKEKGVRVVVQKSLGVKVWELRPKQKQ